MDVLLWLVAGALVSWNLVVWLVVLLVGCLVGADNCVFHVGIGLLADGWVGWFVCLSLE